jgi:peptidoglycan/xylan/chitin deacetylase (PgdA/CDA1 family)
MGVRSAILTWHSLDDSGSVISTSPSVFREQMEYLSNSGIPVLPLEKAVVTPGSVALTFDDGFANLAEHAFPLLERFRFPATVFVVSDYCGRTNNWPSQPSGFVPRLALLGWKELAGLPPLISTGAHTATHPFLDLLGEPECERELLECRDAIEQRTSRRVHSLAYPYGAASESVRQTARRHFDIAVGTSLRFLSPGADPLDLPRIDMFYLRGSFHLQQLFTVSGEIYLKFRGAVRETRQRLATATLKSPKPSESRLP